MCSFTLDENRETSPCTKIQVVKHPAASITKVKNIKTDGNKYTEFKLTILSLKSFYAK